MSDFQGAFAAVRAERNKPQDDDRWCPAIDEAARLSAERIRGRLSKNIALSWDEWCRLTAAIQSEVAIAIRHSVYDPPVFPSQPITSQYRDNAA